MKKNKEIKDWEAAVKSQLIKSLVETARKIKTLHHHTVKISDLKLGKTIYHFHLNRKFSPT